MNLKQSAKKLREAKAAFEKNKTYENAIEVQRAERIHRDLRKSSIRPV